MAEKTFVFEIEISGSKQSVETIKGIQDALKKLRESRKEAEIGSEAYKKITDEIQRTEGALKKLAAEQKKTSALAAVNSAVPNSYKQWQAEVKLLNSQLEDLSETDLKGTAGQTTIKRINELQEKLKGFDANIGKFQRNVGDYSNGVLKALGQSRLGARIDAISQQFGALGSVVAGAGVAGAVVAGVIKIGQAVGAMVKEFDEAKKAVETFGEGTVENAQKASEGVLATSKTFGVSAEQISKAAQQLAIQGGTSFEEALDKINNGLVNGQEDAGKYLETIAEFPKQFSAAGNASEEYSQKQRAALERNKQLAAAQGELSKSFARLSETLAPAIDAVKTAGTKALTFLLDFWNGLAGAFTSGYEGLKSLANETVAFFERATSTITGGLYGVSAAEQDARKRRKEEQDAQLASDKAVADRLEQEAGARFKRLKKGLGDSFGELTEEQRLQFKTYSALAKLQAEQAGKQAGEAADLGFKAGLASLPADIRAQFDDNRKVLTDEQKKAQEEASKQRAAAAEKERAERKQKAEQLKKDQTDFEKDFLNRQKQDAEILLDLTRELYTAQRELIKSEYDKQIATENAKLNDANDARTKAYKKKEEELIATEQRAVELYGAGSEKVRQVISENETFLLNLRSQYNAITEAETQAHNDRITAINKQAAEDRATEQLNALEKDLEGLRNRYSKAEALQSEADRTELLQMRGLGAAKEQIEIEDLNNRREAIRKEIERLDAEDVKTAQATGGLAGLTDEQKKQLQAEKDARVLERKKLNNDLLEADIEFEEQTTENAKKAAEDRTKLLQETISGTLEFAGKGIAVFADFQKSLSDAALKQLEEQAKGRESAIKDLEEKKATEIGLQAEATQQQIDNETKALEELNDRKKKIDEEQKKATKARAIAESIINTAVAVTKVIANPVLAAITGVLGAIQTAAIIAQPLATGGLVTPYEGISGGAVNRSPNAPKSKAGDEVLAYLSTGEVVLTKQQADLIGAPTLASAGVRGFAGGSPSTDIRPNPAIFTTQASGANTNASQVAQVISEQVTQAVMPYVIQVVNEKITKLEVTIDPRTVSTAQKIQTKLDNNTKL
jgi:hypothetical protein